MANRYRGQPYGVDYWHRQNGRWQLETFGAGVTFGGNNVALGLGPDGQPIVVCLSRDRSKLAVWERDSDGNWAATYPDQLHGAGPGHFDLAVRRNGELNVVFCPAQGPPVCVTRSRSRLPSGTSDGALDDSGPVRQTGPTLDSWQRTVIADCAVSHMIECIATEDALHVVFGGGKSADSIRDLYLATKRNGAWSSRVIATCDEGRHVGRTGIAADEEIVVVAWEEGPGERFLPKDYGGRVGRTRLTVVRAGAEPVTQTLAEPGGRPAVALSQDGQTAWVGVYSGNDHGDDFRIVACGLGKASLKPIVQPYDSPTLVTRGCLNEIRSGNATAQRRGFERIDMSRLEPAERNELIDQFFDNEDDVIRVSVVRELARSSDALFRQRDRIHRIAEDPNPLVPHQFYANLPSFDPLPPWLATEVLRALGSGRPVNRLTAADWLRRNPEAFPDQLSERRAVEALARTVDHSNATDSGSPMFALELLGLREAVLSSLQDRFPDASPIDRANAALVLFRLGQEVDLAGMEGVFESERSRSKADWIAQLAICGLAGQLRTADCVPLLERALAAKDHDVRQAAAYALRSIATTAELQAVAKHPNGSDLPALRHTENVPAEEQQARTAAIAVLEEALSHSDPNVRTRACDALNHVRSTQSVALIRELLGDPDLGVRVAARTATGVLSGDDYSQCLISLDEWRKGSQTRKLHRLNPVFRKPTELVDGVVQVGGDKQLFLDDFLIEASAGVERTLHAFKKHPRSPLFQAQVPWEEGWADSFMSTVIYDPAERCFKLWYRCGPRHSLKGYAVSEDGIHWQRPDIAREAWGEFEHHNLLGFEGKIATWKKPGNNVIYRPDLDPAQRYQSLFYQHDKTYCVSNSPDGIVWSQPRSVQPAYGDVVSLMWDPGRKKYLFFPKYMRRVDGFTRRSLAAVELSRLDESAARVFPFVASRREDAIVADGASRAYGSLLPDTIRPMEFHAEIYSVTAISYEGYVVALYDLWTVIGSREGPLDMLMKVSRDMKTWHDVDFPRRALSIGRFGQWDSGMVYGGNTMIVVDDEIRLYYLGANMGHCTRILPTTKPYHTLGAGLATLRLDGFASMRAKNHGELTTRPLQMNGKRLVVNAACEGGALRVELLDADSKPIAGYARDDCDPFTGDSIRHTVSWKGRSDVSQLAGQTIRLRFCLENSDLFAFQFSDAAGDK